MSTSLRLPKPLSRDELRRIHAVADPVVAAALVFLEETGLRASEFEAITTAEAARWPRPHRWCGPRCRRHRAVLRVIGKGPGGMATGGGKERLVVLAPVALRAAAVLREASPNGHLLPWPQRTFRWHLERLSVASGVHVHAHRLRHTFLTQLAEAGVPLEVIAEMAGHASVDVTRAYVAIAERRKVEALTSRARMRRRHRR